MREAGSKDSKGDLTQWGDRCTRGLDVSGSGCCVSPARLDTLTPSKSKPLHAFLGGTKIYVEGQGTTVAEQFWKGAQPEDAGCLERALWSCGAGGMWGQGQDRHTDGAGSGRGPAQEVRRLLTKVPKKNSSAEKIIFS